MIFILTGGAVILVWGIAHIVPVRSVVAGFGELSKDNRRILVMEWVSEGLTLVFLGVLTLCLFFTPVRFTPAAVLTYRLVAGMLLVMAAWTRLTGAKTKSLPMKLCPLVKTLAAAAIALGSWLQ